MNYQKPKSMISEAPKESTSAMQKPTMTQPELNQQDQENQLVEEEEEEGVSRQDQAFSPSTAGQKI